MRAYNIKKSLSQTLRLYAQTALLFLFAFSTPADLHASYLPDENFQPVWNGDGEEPAEGPDWNDDEGDSVPNWLEDYYGTDKWAADTDSDGLSDWDEIFGIGTDPTLWDTDGNGLSDADDLIQPPDAGDMPAGEPNADDFDGDGLPDLWELAYAFDAYDPSDASQDPDGDYLTNLEEYLFGTDPNTWDDATTVTGSGSGGDENSEPEMAADEDQDGDGLPDAWELANGLDPTDPGDIADDPDGDFILNIEEYQNGADPQVEDDFWVVMGYPIDTGLLTRQDDGTERDADWDGDGVTNLEEVVTGSDPRSPEFMGQPEEQVDEPGEEESDDSMEPSDQSIEEMEAEDDLFDYPEEPEEEETEESTDEKIVYIEDSWDLEISVIGQETTDEIKEIASRLGSMLKSNAPKAAANLAEIGGTGILNAIASTGTLFEITVTLKYHAERDGAKLAGSEGALSKGATEDGTVTTPITFSTREILETGDGTQISRSVDKALGDLRLELENMNK